MVGLSGITIVFLMSNIRMLCFPLLFPVPSSVLTSEALLPPLVPASLPPATPKTHSASRPRPQTSDRWCAVIRRRHCTACRITSVVFSNASGVRLSERPLPLPPPPPPREQTATASLHQSSYVDFLMLRPLIRTAPGKEGGRNTKITTRARRQGLQKLRLF